MSIDLRVAVPKRVAIPQLVGTRTSRYVKSMSVRGLSFLLAVALPTLLVFLYLILFAAKEYVTEIRFTVQSVAGPTAGSSGQGGQASTGASASAASSTAASFLPDFMIIDYLQSPQVILDLQKTLDLDKIYDNKLADPLSRFWWGDGSTERLLTYWNNFVLYANFDETTGLATVDVRGFTPEDSLKVGQAVSKLSENLINDMVMRPLNDAVKYAETSVVAAEDRVKKALVVQRDFRNAQGTTNPGLNATNNLTLEATLQQNISTMSAQLTALQRYLTPTAPAVTVLRGQIQATEAELKKVTQAIGDGGTPESAGSAKAATASAGSGSLVTAMDTYESIELEVSFAQTYYNTMLATLESARLNAAVQHEYVDSYVRPSLPIDALYPRPFLWTFLTFLVLFVLWTIGVLFYYSMRDHAA